MKQSLQSSEWVLVGSLLLIMASLVFVSKVNAHRSAAVLAEEPLQLPAAEAPTEVTVTVRGAVTETTKITLPAKSRICDLKTKLSLTPEADKRFFRRRKLLKEGEVIEVPKKQLSYTKVVSKVGNMPRRRPEFGPGEAGVEAAKFEKFSDADGAKFSGCPTPAETNF